MRLHIEVQVWRGAILESRHRVLAAVCDADGGQALDTGDAGRVTTFRSCAKPFQLLPLVERGHADSWRVSDDELAVMAASHTGSREHITIVERVLSRLGLDASHLACGYHDPVDPESLAEVRAHPERRSALHNNCSGKHAGMLCLARSEGWPIEGYERPGHPVQQLMRRTVGEMTGVPADNLMAATDGCSVVVYGLPIGGMARAYARLASATASGDARSVALDRIRRAMASHPRLVGGEGRLSTTLMQSTGGRLVSKAGGEGLECVALPARQLGVTVKCEDGEARAVGPAVIAVLEQLGELTEAELASLAAIRRPVLRNHAGLEVGHIEASVRIPAATS